MDTRHGWYQDLKNMSVRNAQMIRNLCIIFFTILQGNWAISLGCVVCLLPFSTTFKRFHLCVFELGAFKCLSTCCIFHYPYVVMAKL